jgi:hypothetical protein
MRVTFDVHKGCPSEMFGMWQSGGADHRLTVQTTYESEKMSECDNSYQLKKHHGRLELSIVEFSQHAVHTRLLVARHCVGFG